MTIADIHRYYFQERPKAGQKQRQGSGAWEQGVNRQQRRLVRVFDQWAAELKRELKKLSASGADSGELSRYIDDQVPMLEEKLLETTNQGIIAAGNASGGNRADNPAIQRVIRRQIDENVALVKERLIPHIHAKLTIAAATGLLVSTRIRQMNKVFNNLRAAPAQYAGGWWVTTFEVQKELGGQRERERISAGQPVEKVRWVLDPRAEHCKDSAGFHGCPSLAGEYPNWNALPTVPAGQVTCRGNCRCHIEVFRDGEWRRGVYDD